MLKLSVPTRLGEGGRYLGQTAFGTQELPTDGDEAVAQQWVAVTDDESALTCCNVGCYGSDYADGEMRLSLLRSPTYSGHPVGDREIAMQDRYLPRIDQGVRRFRFAFRAGPAGERLSDVTREARMLNEAPMALSFFPCGEPAEAPRPLATLSDTTIDCPASKRGTDGESVVVRLFEPTGRKRRTTLRLPAAGIERKVELGAFEVKTLTIALDSGAVRETDLMER
jgi:alpha-mannosidase